jgi:hypothetical protein
MPDCKLIAFTPFPPGSFPFKETHNGITYDFPDVGLDIQMQSAKIASFRKANGFPRASLSEATEDLNVYTCRRLGCDPRFCSDGTQPVAIMSFPQSKGCRSCGAKV